MENVFRIWPTLTEMASDLGAPYPKVQAWKVRGRIPAKYDLALIAAAKARGHELSLEELATLRCVPLQSEAS